MRGKITVAQLERMAASDRPKVLFTRSTGSEFAKVIRIEYAFPATGSKRIKGVKPQHYRKLTVEFDEPMASAKPKQRTASGWVSVNDELITNER